MAGCYYRKYSYLFLLYLLVLTSFNASAQKNNETKTFRLVLDAGHGGEDPGAVGMVLKEKDVTLDLALRVGKLIESQLPNVEVLYTRDKDIFVPLHERADIANKSKADLFISIHINANLNKAVYGFETYVMGVHTTEKNRELAMKENSVIVFEKDYESHYEGYDPNSAESFIIFSLVQNVHLDQSLSFAALVQEKFKTETRHYDRGVKQAGFLVLWRTTMPSVLVEAGFLSNPKEEKYLKSEAGKANIANAIVTAFVQYKESIERTEKEIVSTQSVAFDESTTEGIIFRVQIFSSQKQVPEEAPDFKKCKSIEGGTIIKEYASGKMFKYAIGSHTDYNAAKEMLKKVKAYYPDAFIIAEENNKIIPLQEAINKTKK